jgi:uncharacterized protein
MTRWLYIFALCLLPFSATAEEGGSNFDSCVQAYNGQQPEAAALCQPFADNGNREAMKMVGDMHFWGWGSKVKQDDALARLWYKRAAAKGQAEAKYNLGVMYEQGRGIPIDYATSAKWYLSAAKDGHMLAQLNVANMYAKGAGTRQDDVAAAKWYEYAASQGEPTAQYNIGNRYARGLGVPQNVVEAYKWYAIAERSLEEDGVKNDAVKNKALLRESMDQQAVEEAEKLAAEWQPSHPLGKKE